MEKGLIFGVREMYTKDNFMKDANMGKAFGLHLLEKPIKDIIKMIKNVEVGNTYGAMDANLKESSKTTKSTINYI